jgi:hypothetical protein
MSNIERFKKDVERLISEGHDLYIRMCFESRPEETMKAYKGHMTKAQLEAPPSIGAKYQTWYSESLSMLGVILPERVADFRSYYDSSKPIKELTYSTYTIRDYLKGTQVTRGWEKEVIVDGYAAVSLLNQQVAIVVAASKRFESSLFDIRAVVQADLFDNELDAAEELNKKGFTRGGGAIAGVVLEGHLATVCKNHAVKITKSKPTLADFNDSLKSANVIDQTTWRFIQHLGDIRNNCDHKKSVDPKKEEVHDLIEGVKKIAKTVF